VLRWETIGRSRGPRGRPVHIEETAGRFPSGQEEPSSQDFKLPSTRRGASESTLMKRTTWIAVVSVGFLWMVLLAGCAGGGSASSEGFSEGAVPAGSVATDRSHYQSVVDMLRGRVPGLEVIETSPGAIEVRIRGLNQSLQESGQQPLVVVDGVPSSRPAGEALLALDPRDVSSIEVLKDVSSTAVYGTRGANGVIIVRLVRRS